MIEWHEPDRRPWVKIVAIVVIEAFLVTSITWSPSVYAQAVPEPEFSPDSIYGADWVKVWNEISGLDDINAAERYVEDRNRLIELAEAEKEEPHGEDEATAKGAQLESFSGAIPMGAPNGPENPDGEETYGPDENGVTTAEGNYSAESGNSYTRYEYEDGTIHVNNYRGQEEATRKLDSVFIYNQYEANVFSWYDSDGHVLFQSWGKDEGNVYFTAGENAGQVMAVMEPGQDGFFEIARQFYDNDGNYLDAAFAEYKAYLNAVEDVNTNNVAFDDLLFFLTKDSDDSLQYKYYNYLYDVQDHTTKKLRVISETMRTDIEEGLEEGAKSLFIYEAKNAILHISIDVSLYLLSFLLFKVKI